ncbi:hypothetical protein SDC9_198349 [bioreactor metagenome]|uniref:Uncharacterized protein n=1 Tax=bioreactor metagenome TaxID=1076179 RepID=A0A645IIB3_9ZZZZ
MGSVNTMPMIAETNMPMGMGFITVAVFIMLPKAVIMADTTGDIYLPAMPPAMITEEGTSTISTFVFPDINLPTSTPTRAAIKAPIGSPTLIPY